MQLLQRLFTILAFVFALSSCSLLDRVVKIAPATDRGLRNPSQDIRFSAYHNIRPSRKAKGAVYQVLFKAPKDIKEVGFEFVNYNVKIHQVELILANGIKLPVRGFRPQLLNKKRRHLTLRNLPRSGKVSGVRFRAEGFQNNDVVFTASFFSPEGFLPQEQGRPIALKRKHKHRSLSSSPELTLPHCLPHNPELSGLLFDVENLRQMNQAEQNYFCHSFVPRFKSFIQNDQEVASFLRTGENLEKPLVSVGQHFKYNADENVVIFPLSLRSSQFRELSSKLSAFRNRKAKTPKRGLSQEEDSRYGIDQSYDEFMRENSGNSSLGYIENDERWGFEDSESPKENCQKGMTDLGISKNQAKKQCRDVRGFEQGHLGCMNFLVDKYILVHNTHHYCLEARGKLAAYQGCMGKLLELGMNHYDSNLFCQRTPSRYMGGQLECLELMVKTGHSRYKSTQTCQKFSGREKQLNSCLKTHSGTMSKEKLLSRCASR